MALMKRLAMLGTARNYARRNAPKVHSGIDKVADAARGRVGDRHRGTVDRAASLLKKAATGSSGTASDRRNGATTRGARR